MTTEEKVSKVKESDEPKAVSAVEVPTQYNEMIQLPDGRVVGFLEAFAALYNEVLDLKKRIGY